MRFNSLRTRVLLALSAMIVSVLFAGNILGQTGSSTVSGSVVDAQGRVIQGASVRIVNEETSYNRNVVTGGDGTYNFVSVPPGT